MPTTPDFDDTLLREHFMRFASATLPSPHSSTQAHATVRHRRRVHIGLATAAAALLLGIPAALVALLGPNRSHDVVPGPTVTTPVPSVSASPSPSPSPAQTTADLTVGAGAILLRGSTGSPPGTARVAVRNNGPDAVDQLDLTFTVPAWAHTTGPAWAGCTVDSGQSSVRCPVSAPPVGGTRAYGYDFTVDTNATKTARLTVTVAPHDRTDPNPADNVGTYAVSTNGGNDVGISAGGLVTNGTTGSVSIAVSSHGYNDATYVVLTFQHPPALQPAGDGFAGCKTFSGQMIGCVVLAPKIGQSLTYTYQFAVDRAQPAGQLTVKAAPGGAEWDNNLNDNTAVIEVCTNTC